MRINLRATIAPAGGEKLFRIFSRFEYALKESGFVEKGDGAEPKVCWDKFANECLGGEFFRKVSEDGLAPILLANPPKKQIVTGKSLDWRSVDSPKGVAELFAAVRRTRNNLFHGGKHGAPDADRNEALIAESICLLLEALKTCETVKATFEDQW
jgi:hypothetical protein